jgi:RNA polymerase sigma-70 factor, ECF subfamily
MIESTSREAEFRRIYETYYRQVAAYARRRLEEQDAQDVVADTFLVAWRRIEDVPAGQDALPWLYAVARRTVAQVYRSRHRRLRLTSRLKQFVREKDQGVPDESDDNAVVHQALATLRPGDQEILRLADWEELEPRQLGPVLGCSANAASIRLHRAHRRFERALQEIEGRAEALGHQEQAL